MRFGVTASLVSGLIGMAGFAVVASVLAVQSFGQFQDTLRTITSDSLPTLVLAASIASESQAVTADAPALVAARTQFAREAIAFRIAEREGLLRERIDVLGRAAVAPESIDRMRKLADDLFASVAALSDLVGRRIDADSDHAVARGDVLDLMRDLNALSLSADSLDATTGETTVVDAPIAGSDRWAAAAGEALGVLLAGLSARTAAELRQLQSDWHRAVATAEQLYNAAADPADDWTGYRSDLMAVGDGDLGVFKTRSDQLELENRVLSAVDRNKVLSKLFVSVAADLSQELHRNLVARNQMFEAELDERSRYVVLVGAAGCIGAVLIVLHIHARVIRRLRTLQDGIQRSVAGDAVEIPTDYRDEIGDMARALSYFVQTIRDREARFRDYAETSCDCYWESDATGTFTYVSNSDFQTVGIHVGALLLPKGDTNREPRGASIEALAEAVAKRQAFGELEFGARGNGWLRHFDLSGKPVFEDDGTFVGYRGTATDITTRRNAEIEVRDSEKRLIEILESSPTGVSITTHSGNRLFCNTRFLELHQLDRESALAGNASDSYVHPEDRQRLLDTMEKQGRVDGAEVEFKHHDGTRWWSIMHWRPMMFDGQPAHTSWQYDITGRKQNEEDLRAAKDAAEVAFCELRETQERMIQAEKMTSLAQLVAGVAHEINTPVGIGLTATSHLSQMTFDVRNRFEGNRLRKSDFEDFISTAEETTRLLMSNLNRASELIQSFKKVSVDQATGDRRRFMLHDYLNEIILSLKPQIRRSPCDISIAVNSPGKITMDSYPGSLSQVITNLVINAIVHAFDGRETGKIAIEAVLGDGGDTVSIRVSDDGTGIPATDLKKVFDPFFTTKRGSGGSGLGLNIVFNTVTQSLGGRIHVDSKPDRGTVFTIELPTALAETKNVPQPGGQGPDVAASAEQDPEASDRSGVAEAAWVDPTSEGRSVADDPPVQSAGRDAPEPPHSKTPQNKMADREETARLAGIGG